MKKGTKREVTIKDLRSKNKLLVKTIIMVLIIASISTLIMTKIDPRNADFIFCIYIIFAVFILAVSLINVTRHRGTTSKISLKNKKIKTEFIKRKAKEGDVKEFLIIKDPEIIRAILSKGIKKVEVTTCIIDQWLVEIELRNGCCFSTQISGRDFIQLLNNDLQEFLMESLVDKIEIQDDQMSSTKIRIGTTIPDYNLYKEQSIEEDLLEMFDIKESCYARPT